MVLSRAHQFVLGKPARNTRHGKRSQKPGGIAARRPAPDAFLRCQFEPIQFIDGRHFTNHRIVQQHFFRSLKHLADLYELPYQLLTSQKPFPGNIEQSLALAEKALHNIDPDINLTLVAMEISGPIAECCLATYREYATGPTLYYIPLETYWKVKFSKTLIDNLPIIEGGYKQHLDVLDSIFSYLSEVVDIPRFTDEGTFIGSQYDWLEEQSDPAFGSDMDEDEAMGYLAMIKTDMANGKACFDHFRKPVHLKNFGKRIQSLAASSSLDKQLKQVAQRFYRMYQEYPDRSILPSVKWDAFIEELEAPDGGGMIDLDKYLSFVYEDQGVIYDYAIQSLDCDLSENLQQNMPKAWQLFNEPQQTIDLSVDFEQGLFESILDLYDYLLALENLLTKPDDAQHHSSL
ncbi:hypothetical protein [Tellurirhabdus bombi]|uniref:hypothetical protein n=1 Tax=Tellurirhabdus bombi TaxID=2907205 RepID=UPI001F3A9443|nr:hypothetical protein [Tellurirhabdus bombi]